MRDLAAMALASFRMDALFRAVNRGRVLILAYHGVTDIRDGALPDTMVSLELFRRQIGFVSRHYRIIPLSDAVRGLKGETPLPARAAVITFDDGYRNNLTLALPVLEKHGAPAAVFLSSSYVGGDRLLPVDELFLLLAAGRWGTGSSVAVLSSLLGSSGLRQDGPATYRAAAERLKRLPGAGQKEALAAMRGAVKVDRDRYDRLASMFQLMNRNEVRSISSGGLIEIGAHTENHEILANLAPDLAMGEISGSKRALEEMTGKPVRFFAYPNGKPSDFDGRHVSNLRDNGFSAALTTVPGLNRPFEDPYRLKRFCVSVENSANPAVFSLIVSGFNAFARSLSGKGAAS